MKKICFVSLSIALFTIAGCKKQESLVTKSESDTKRSSISKEKVQKIKKYISINWQVPVESVLYDASKKQFQVGKVVLHESEQEHFYDISNEYKLKYEN